MHTRNEEVNDRLRTYIRWDIRLLEASTLGSIMLQANCQVFPGS